MIRLLVTGGREYGDVAVVFQQLNYVNRLLGIGVLIHGAAAGADSLAKDWADIHGIELQPFPANWKDIDTKPCRIGINRYGKPYNKLAGLNRNTQMIVEGKPSHCVVFPGGEGTADMRGKAIRHRLAVLNVNKNGESEWIIRK